MTKLSALRRFLLPCLSPSPSATSSSTTIIATSANKKRLSTSLRDDIVTHQPESERDDSSDTDSLSLSLSSIPTAPPRPSRTMVTGTVFGHRRGPHVWFCVQPSRLSTRPSLLLQIPLPTQLLVKEIHCGGLVRIALQAQPGPHPLRSTPTWAASCNARPLGFAARKRPTQAHRALLSALGSITVGAGVVPTGSGFDGLNGLGEGELMYMRASYECIVGGPDSESFHLISPDQCSGQELSIFLMRSQ